MTKYLILLFLAGCMSPSSKSAAEAAAEAAATASAAVTASQTASHASESALKTNSTPVTVICIQNNMGRADGASCLRGTQDGTIDKITKPEKK